MTDEPTRSELAILAEMHTALIESRASSACPACAEEKTAGEPFCQRCFSALSPMARRGLYAKLGGGYEPAFAVALRELARYYAHRVFGSGSV